MNPATSSRFDPGTYHKRFHCDKNKQKLIAALRDEESASDLALRQKCLLDYESRRPGARPVLEAHNPPDDPENNSTCTTTVALFIKDPDTRKRQHLINAR